MKKKNFKANAESSGYLNGAVTLLVILVLSLIAIVVYIGIGNNKTVVNDNIIISLSFLQTQIVLLTLFIAGISFFGYKMLQDLIIRESNKKANEAARTLLQEKFNAYVENGSIKQEVVRSLIELERKTK